MVVDPTSADMVDFVSLIRYVDTITENMVGMSILILTFVVVMVALKEYETMKAVVSASYITMLVSMVLVVLQLLNPTIILVTIIASALATLALFRD